MSTTQVGDDFEFEIASLIEASGRTVSLEQTIGHKRVDLVVTELRYGQPWVTAVECKAHKKTLTKSDVVKIWTDYRPLVDRGLVNEVLVVALNKFAATAMTFANSTNGLFLQTASEVQKAVLDMREYCRYAIDQYEHSSDNISEYFVHPLVESGSRLAADVNKWIDGEDCHWESGQPIAILGGYGLGKSSFAKWLAHSLARSYLEGRSARSPILIRLGEISSEQSLEGLLGQHFTALHETPNYTFSRFMALNRSGAFVVILDGFDEMKQLLSWEQFKFNLSMLNRLHSGNSRVILLGRPTAFETDDEHLEALQGRVVRNKREYISPDWPRYQEVELLPLTPKQIEEFLHLYLTRPSGVSDKRDTLNYGDMLTMIRNRRVRDLARRPVQLRMLATILPHYVGDLDDLDAAKLYDAFIDELIDRIMERENAKESRLAFSRAIRRDFLAKLAFWLWSESATALVRGGTIPDSLVAPFVRAGQEVEVVRRDLIVASPLDRRFGELISFPHRSFQEFLVAAELLERLRVGQLDLTSADRMVTDEVAAFMTLMKGTGDTAALNSRRGHAGVLHERTLRALTSDLDLDALTEQARREPQIGFGIGRQWPILEYARRAIGDQRPDYSLLMKTVPTRSVDLLLHLFAASSSQHVDNDDRNQLLTEIVGRMLRDRHNGLVAPKMLEAGRVVPIGDSGFLGSVDHAKWAQLGIQLGKTRIRQSVRGYAVDPGTRLQVAWFDPVTLSLVERLQPVPARESTKLADGSTRRIVDSVRVDVRALRALFATALPLTTFVHEWTDNGHLAATVKTWGRQSIQGQLVVTDLMSVKRAIDEYFKIRERRHSAQMSYQWRIPPDLLPDE